MNKIFALILGSNPALSVGEIESVISREGIKINRLSFSEEVFLFETDADLSKSFLDKLGGTIKIALIKEKKAYGPDFRSLITSQDLLSLIGAEEKVSFAISVYGLGASGTILKRLEKSLHPLSLNLKKDLKNKKFKVRFLPPKERFFSSVSIVKNGLMEKGAGEILILAAKDHFYLGKTVDIQDFEEYSFRDYGRPERDLVSGTTPPKLAKIMVNLAAVSTDSLIYDPFCGSGTYVQEALLMGYQRVMASDISKKAIEDTTTNIDWLKNQYHSIKEYAVNIFEADATSISEKVDKESIDAIITETYLGPAQKANLKREEAETILTEIRPLYLAAFEQFHQVLKDKATVIIAFPVFETGDGLVYSNLYKEIEEIGFELRKTKNFKDFLTPGGTYLYGRKGQRVLREILVAQKKIEPTTP